MFLGLINVIHVRLNMSVMSLMGMTQTEAQVIIRKNIMNINNKC